MYREASFIGGLSSYKCLVLCISIFHNSINEGKFSKTIDSEISHGQLPQSTIATSFVEKLEFNSILINIKQWVTLVTDLKIVNHSRLGAI